MGLFGDLVKGAMGGFATIPDAPPAPFVDPANAQLDSVKGNQAALPGLIDLGEDINAYNLRERAKALGAGIPHYNDIADKGGELISSQLRGELPEDVANQVARRSNAKAFAGGYGGSPAADNLTARDLGLTSLDIMGRGQAAAPGWLSTMNSVAVPPQFNVQSGFMSPGEHVAAEQWNENSRFSRDWLQAQLDSIPDPETAAIAADVGQITDVVATAALAWAGGALGAASGIAGGAAMGGQLGGAIGGGGGMGGAASQFGGTIGAMMGGGGGGAAGGVPVTPNWGTTYQGAASGYIPAVNNTVSPYGNASLYQPSADIYSLGGYQYGGI